MRRATLAAAVVSASVVVLSAGRAVSAAEVGMGEMAPDGPGVVTGLIDAVTVYRGQALVTRAIDVPGGTGLREVVVTNLPEAILPASLYAENADGVEVRSVSYRVRPVGEDGRDSVRAAEKAVRDAQDALEGARARQKYLEWQGQYLDRLEGFVAPAAQTELKSGVLNAETLSKLTDLVTTKRKALADESQKLALELRTLGEAVELKQRELGVLTASTSRTAREAVVFVNATKSGAKVRLSYLVSGATWSPSYNLRIEDAKSEKAKVEYQASVQQMSGEDWGNVSLTLSTATPALVATGPSLQPMALALASPQELPEVRRAQAMLRDEGYADAKKSLAMQQRELERNRAMNTGNLRNNDLSMGQQFQQFTPLNQAGETAGAAGGQVVLSLDDGLNSLAKQSELLDLVSNARVERKSKSEPVSVRQGDEGISVTYRVGGRTSMPSRADQQLIQIAQMELPAKVVKSATPTLTQYVYNEAELTNTGEILLLAGPAASYIAGEFVGSSGVPTVTAGESFKAGFGIDSSLRAAKELVERTESTQGGNRIIEFTYKLTIENFGKNAAAVRLLDRVPSPKAGEIKLTMQEVKPALSEDSEYLETDRKQNLLRWDVTVQPGARGTQAHAVEYRFKLEFDKQMMLSEGR